MTPKSKFDTRNSRIEPARLGILAFAGVHGPITTIMSRKTFACDRLRNPSFGFRLHSDS
jgi:hypothetical protein